MSTPLSSSVRRHVDVHVPPLLTFVGESVATKQATELAIEILRDAGPAGLSITFDDGMMGRLDRLVDECWDDECDGEVDGSEWRVWEMTAAGYARNHPMDRETTDLTPFIMHHVCRTAETVYERCMAQAGEVGLVRYHHNGDIAGMDYGPVRVLPEGAGEEVMGSGEVKRPKVIPVAEMRKGIRVMKRDGALRIRAVDTSFESTEDVSRRFISVILQMIEDMHYHRAGLSMLNTYEAMLLLRRVRKNELVMSQIVMRDRAEIPPPRARPGLSTAKSEGDDGQPSSQSGPIHNPISMLKLHIALLILSRDLEPHTEGWEYWVREPGMDKGKRKRGHDDEGVGPGGGGGYGKGGKAAGTSARLKEAGQVVRKGTVMTASPALLDGATRSTDDLGEARSEEEEGEDEEEEEPSLTLSPDSNVLQGVDEMKTPSTPSFPFTLKSKSAGEGGEGFMLDLQLGPDSTPRTLALHPYPSSLSPRKTKAQRSSLSRSLSLSALTLPALCLTSLISSGQLGVTYRASLILPPSPKLSPSTYSAHSSSSSQQSHSTPSPLSVVAKITYVESFNPEPTKRNLTRRQARAFAQDEAKMYARLEPCWGDVVPRFYGFWTDDGNVNTDSDILNQTHGDDKGVLVLVLEEIEGDIGDWKKLSTSDKNTIIALYARLHDLGVVHNDVQTRHVRLRTSAQGQASIKADSIAPFHSSISSFRRGTQLASALVDPTSTESAKAEGKGANDLGKGRGRGNDFAIVDFDQSRVVMPNGPACRAEMVEVRRMLWDDGNGDDDDGDDEVLGRPSR